MMQFEIEKQETSIIKVFGVGGGGSNAVNHMYKAGIKGVDFFICNTDEQALEISPVPNKIQLGLNLTGGRGAGSIAEVGKNAAIENIDQIKEILENDTKMLFITAGMGGGTGTGAAPIIARLAKELGILTVAIVTYPFGFEGRKRSNQADVGLEELRDSVDTCVIICNDKLREIYGNLSLSDAFAKADDILTIASKGIAEIITRTGYINVDFEDVRTVMTDSGVAIMGSSLASGENRALKAAQQALESPLLNDNNIEGANYILLNITSGNNEVMMDEISQITDYIQDEAGLSADIIWGTGKDEELEDNISITLIATGFEANKSIGGIQTEKKKAKVVHALKSEENNGSQDKEENNVLKQETLSSKHESNSLNSQPKAEQIKMELNLPISEKTNDSTANNESIIFENNGRITEDKVDSPKIVHNLYEESDLVNNSEIQEENHIVSEESKINFTTPSNYIKEDSNEESKISNIEDKPNLSFNNGLSFSKNDGNSTFADKLDSEERLKRSQQRVSQLNNLTEKLKSPSNISDLEDEPAYIRKKIRLDNLEHSSENKESRFTIGNDDDNNPEIRSNNSFLHDNVD